MLRTHEAGTLRATHTGQTVTLTGWVAKRRDHGGVAFIDLRDASGIVQVVARDEVLTGAAHDLRSEYVVQAGNVEVQKDVERLRTRLTKIRDMNKEELRALHKEQLRAAPEEGSKGAGLGIMEIARRASKPIEFDFTDVDGDYAFFTLKASV